MQFCYKQKCFKLFCFIRNAHDVYRKEKGLAQLRKALDGKMVAEYSYMAEDAWARRCL